MDPFDSVTPIGKRDPEPQPEARDVSTPTEQHHAMPHERFSRAELQTRRIRNRADQSAGPRQRPPSVKRPGRARGGLLTAPEALGMVTKLSRSFYGRAGDESKPEAQRNFATRSLATMLDKWTILSARPEQQHGFVEAVTIREPLRDLGLVIAGAKSELKGGQFTDNDRVAT